MNAETYRQTGKSKSLMYAAFIQHGRTLKLTDEEIASVMREDGG